MPEGPVQIAVQDPLGRATRADCTAEFSPLGIRLRLETNSPEILDVARGAFGRYAPPTPGAARFTIRLLADKAITEAPPWPAPVFRGQGDYFYISVGTRNTVVADLRQRYAFGFVAPDLVKDRSLLQSTFLECLVFTMTTHGAGSTHTYVHASAVARGDAGLVFSGPREAGKTTLAYACARRGFKVVTDDVVYLNEGSEGLIAWGKPWHLRFLRDGASLFPELKHGPADSNDDGKDVMAISVEDVLPGRTQTHCVPAGLFFLSRSAAGSSCESLRPDAAVDILSRDLVYDQLEVMEKHRRTWLRLAQRGSYILRYGKDLDSTVRFLERFLEGQTT